MDKYAVLTTGNNVVINIVLWDGVEAWGPGKGHTTVKIKDDQWCDIGAVYDKTNDKFTPSDTGDKDDTRPDY